MRADDTTQPANCRPVRRRPANRIGLLGGALVFSVLLGVSLVEIGLRVASPLFPEPARSLVQEAARMRLSNVRMYPRAVAIRLPADRKAEVLVVGDSFPFGSYEASEDVYPRLIAEQLGTTVINLAVGSTSPPAYNRMIEVGARYHPRVVIYAVFANDLVYEPEVGPRRLALENMSRTLEGDRGLFFERYDAKEKVLDAVRAGTNHLVSYALIKIFQQPSAKFAAVPWWQGNNFFMFPERSYWDVMLDWEHEAVRRGIEANHRLVTEAYRFSTDALGAKFLVVLQPSKEMVYGPLTGELRSRVYSRSWDRTYEELTARLRESGIPSLDLTNDLRRQAQAGAKLYHSIDGHFNEEGHRAAAESVARAISPLLSH